MKDTIFNSDDYHATTSIMTNTSTITNETIKHNIKINHTKSVEDYINSQVDNELIAAKPPVINPEDESLPRGTNRTLSQLRDDKSPFLYSYLNKIDPQNHPSPLCPLCKADIQNTKHLFACIYIKTHLKPLDLWNEPVAVAELLQQWKDALAAAGGGLGTPI